MKRRLSAFWLSSNFVLLCVPAPAAAFWGLDSFKNLTGTKIEMVSGTVFLKRGNLELPAAPQFELATGDVIRLEENGKALLVFADGTKILVHQNANVIVKNLKSRSIQFHIERGLLEAWVKKDRKRSVDRQPPLELLN